MWPDVKHSLVQWLPRLCDNHTVCDILPGAYLEVGVARLKQQTLQPMHVDNSHTGAIVSCHGWWPCILLHSEIYKAVRGCSMMG